MEQTLQEVTKSTKFSEVMRSVPYFVMLSPLITFGKKLNLCEGKQAIEQ